MRQRLRRRLYRKYGGRCAYCQRALVFKKMTLDHLLPRRRVGDRKYWNYVPACDNCNQNKADAVPPLWYVYAVIYARGNAKVMREVIMDLLWFGA